MFIELPHRLSLDAPKGKRSAKQMKKRGAFVVKVLKQALRHESRQALQKERFALCGSIVAGTSLSAPNVFRCLCQYLVLAFLIEPLLNWHRLLCVTVHWCCVSPPAGSLRTVVIHTVALAGASGISHNQTLGPETEARGAARGQQWHCDVLGACFQSLPIEWNI